MFEAKKIMKYFLNIHFWDSVSMGDWINISDLFLNSVNWPILKSLSYLINKMDDVLLKEIQLTQSLTKDEENLLKGIILGYFRKDAIYNKIDKYGQKVS
jgi:hypothetical protein